MLSKKLAVLAAAGAALALSAPAFADPPHWAPAHGWRAKHQNYHHGHRYVVIKHRPYYYAPPPRVVVIRQPAPYYYDYGPVIYGQVAGIGVSVRFP